MLKYVGGTFSPFDAAARVSFIDHIASGVSVAHKSGLKLTKRNTGKLEPDAVPVVARAARLTLPEDVLELFPTRERDLLWLPASTSPREDHLQLRWTRDVRLLRLRPDQLDNRVKLLHPSRLGRWTTSGRLDLLHKRRSGMTICIVERHGL